MGCSRNSGRADFSFFLSFSVVHHIVTSPDLLDRLRTLRHVVRKSDPIGWMGENGCQLHLFAHAMMHMHTVGCVRWNVGVYLYIVYWNTASGLRSYYNNQTPSPPAAQVTSGHDSEEWWVPPDYIKRLILDTGMTDIMIKNHIEVENWIHVVADYNQCQIQVKTIGCR